MKKTMRFLVIFTILSLTVKLAHASLSPFTKTFDQTGNFGVVAAGYGMANWSGGQHIASDTSGTINLNLTGAPIYGEMYWNGFQYDTNPIPGSVTLNGNSIVGTPLPETPGGEDGSGYRADISPYLQQGDHSYTINNVSFSVVNNGFGGAAVYNDPAQYGQIVLYSGNDFAYHGFTGNNGKDTGVLGISITPVDYDRIAQITLMFGGGEDGVRFADRRSYLWHTTTDNGLVPNNLVDEAFAVKHPDPHPLWARDGFEWDTYNVDIPIPANASTLALQMESDDEVPHGESFCWIGATGYFPINNVVPEPATMALFSLGLGSLGLLRGKRS